MACLQLLYSLNQLERGRILKASLHAHCFQEWISTYKLSVSRLSEMNKFISQRKDLKKPVFKDKPGFMPTVCFAGISIDMPQMTSS